MAAIYKGTEKKFSLDIDAEGFDMDEDDFQVEVCTPRSSVVGVKSLGGSADVRIFREDSDSSSSGESGTWWVIVDTQNLIPGDLRVIVTAHVPDANANDGIRNEVDVVQLGKLLKP